MTNEEKARELQLDYIRNGCGDSTDIRCACEEMAEWKDQQFKELCNSGEASDGYHTFNELYDFRREYNAALVNTGVWKAHKSYRHHTGELCFGGGWFIVMIETPFGQISNHYENKYWNEFHCEEKELADEYDGHTEKDVLERLSKCNEFFGRK